jgi:hypothetical protein
MSKELSGVARHDEVSTRGAAPDHPALEQPTGQTTNPEPAARPLRADAQRNRDKLLRVAAEAFTDVGQQIDDLAAAARELPLAHPPADALREWMHAFVDYAAVKRGMVALLKSMMETDSHLFDDARATLYAAAGSLMTAAAEAGEIRPDVGPTEVIRAIGGICMATDRPGSAETAVALVDLVFDGLRYGAPART